MELRLALCLLFCYATSAEKYVLTTLHTVTKSSCHPEFTAVSFVNERQITRFDSENKTLTPIHAWVREALNDHYWDVYKQTQMSEYARLREELNETMKSLGHIKDVHTFQRRSGCEWDDKTFHVKGFDEYGYDGEDFISLDLNRMKYVPHTPLANTTAERWNSNITLLESQKQYYNTECVNWLKRFGRTNLEQTGNISFYQKKPFTPVICHVSGFCPSALKISWRKDGTEIKKNISLGDVLPDGDGTYLRDISIFSDELNISHFTCVVGDSSRDLSRNSLRFENSNSPSDTQSALPIAILCSIAIFIGTIVCVVGLVCYCKKNRSGSSTI
ncbi:major histocompatibility complex class I-related gene protein-like isoform X2 [Salminus brasiliensis]|uniref:major histocompatibility complex class I-related gene protein-like isoform X2 n=1 Tax=Salminus brasiliensis TaxID=930266 RepID=UPI003B8317EE